MWRLSRNLVHTFLILFNSSRRAPVHLTCCTVLQRRAAEDLDTEMDKPVKFSTSKAGSWNSSKSYATPQRDVPVYQPFCVSISLIVFLVYFLYLREENDLDEELNKSLFERVPGLEQKQIELSIKYNREHGKPTDELEARLAELQTSVKQWQKL